MELAYQQYVKRLNYDPYQWPPDISLAQLHSRVSQQGPVNPNGVKCPCCNFQSKKKFKGWLMNDIPEDCQGYGTAIPAFFGLLMYYIFALFVIICLNSIYQLWAVNFTCKEAISVGDKSCIKAGIFYYIDRKVELSTLYASGEQGIATTIIILQTISFYLLLLVNLSSLIYLYKMEKKERTETQVKKFTRHALIIGNIGEIQPKKIIQKLNISSKLQILDVIPLKEYKRYYELFHKRNMIFYKLLSKYVASQDPRTQTKLNNSLIQMHAAVLEQKQKLKTEKCSNLLVFFKHSFSRTLVEDAYSLDQWKRLKYGCKQMFSQSQQWQLPIYVLKVPDVNEIKWQNAGQNIKSKLSGRIKSFFIAIGLVVLSVLIFYVPITWELSTQAKDPSRLTTWQKVIPLLISILLVIIAFAYTNYMRNLSKKRVPLSQFQASKFVLMSSMLFHILFYILIPILFFVIPTYLGGTTKLFVVAQQAFTFVILQVIMNIIDLPYQVWKNKKLKSLSDQRQGFKYNQWQLHQQVQFRDFPLEFRIQSTFKIWSFVLFYAFYIPQMMIVMFIALVILYILEKHNFYHHYALRRAISLQLQKSFLIYFVNFFVFFQCLAYCLNAYYNWMIIAAVAVTLVLLIGNIIFWKCIQPQYNKSKDYQRGLAQRLVQSQKQDNEEMMQNILKAANQYRASYEIFKDSNGNDNLDDEIEEYIKSLDKDVTQSYRQTASITIIEEKRQVEKYIELTNSQMENNID